MVCNLLEIESIPYGYVLLKRVSCRALTSIKDHIYIRAIAVAFLQQAKRLGKVTVSNREHSIEDLLRVQIEAYLSHRADELFNTDAPLPIDLTTAIRSFGAVLDTAQMLLSCLNLDYSSVLRDFLFMNFCPITLPPPGAPVPSALQEPRENPPLIWTISKRVISLIDIMTSSKAEYIWMQTWKSCRTKILTIC